MKCLGCFKSTKYIYCPKCKKELFDNQKIDFKLDFDKKEGTKKTSSSTLPEKTKEQITTTLKNLMEQYHYTQSGAMNLMKYLIKELY